MVRCGGNLLVPQKKSDPSLPRKTDIELVKLDLNSKALTQLKSSSTVQQLQDMQEKLIRFTGINICKQTERGQCKLSRAGDGV